jgi:hypothetical protein
VQNLQHSPDWDLPHATRLPYISCNTFDSLSELQTSFLIPSSQITLKKKKSKDKGVFQHCTFFQLIGPKKITWWISSNNCSWFSHLNML